jgi:type II restriction enzyme
MLEINETTALAIESRYYFKPMREAFEQKVREVGKIRVLDSLTEVMRIAQPGVEKIIQWREADGYIKSIDQARKSVAGNGFQGLIAYSLIALQKTNILNSGLVITLKPRSHPLITRYATIRVGDEIQKPDIDILVYIYTKPEKYPILIYSAKASLRERAGQTYRWKLLMDIATSENCRSIREKYDLTYEAKGDFRVGLITANFYDEIMKPQQQGMLKFFDFAYITKSGYWEKPVSNFSQIIEDLNTLYG